MSPVALQSEISAKVSGGREWLDRCSPKAARRLPMGSASISIAPDVTIVQRKYLSYLVYAQL